MKRIPLKNSAGESFLETTKIVASETACDDLVGVAGVEPTASWTRTKRATNCATPRYSLIIVQNFPVDVKVIFLENLA